MLQAAVRLFLFPTSIRAKRTMSDPEGYFLSRRFTVRSAIATLLVFKTEQGFSCNWQCDCGDVCLTLLNGTTLSEAIDAAERDFRHHCERIHP
jgi:hypothetical protein